MRSTPRETGKAGENAAAAYLNGMGCSILSRNFRCQWGEIDLIVKDMNSLVFVEVKSAGKKTAFNLTERVNHRKRLKLIKSALLWLSENEAACDAMRFDILLMTGLPDGNYRIHWIKNAFTMDENN